MKIAENDRLSISLGVVTRWGSHLKMLTKLRERKLPILSVIFSNDPDVKEFVDPRLKDITDSDLSENANLFWCRINDLIEIISPVCKALTKLEGDGSISLL